MRSEQAAAATLLRLPLPLPAYVMRHAQACFQGYKLDGEPKGTMEELGGLAYYFAPGKSTEKAIVLCVLCSLSTGTDLTISTPTLPSLGRGTDLFGLGVPNCKIVADWFAENTGLPVFVPDLLEGEFGSSESTQQQLKKIRSN